MLVVRPGGPADTDALLELAYLSGKGFTSLPENRETLAQRLELSAASFAGQVDPTEAWYVLMLEDTATGRIEGVAGVKGAVGLQRPHFSFRVVTFTQFSSATSTRFDHQALVLVNECTGHSEVGSLFLRPGRRQAGTGALLARARYMLIAAARERFSQTVMAELRGWFDERDISPFWEGIAAKFFRLPFEQADHMITTTDGQFIADLAPRHPIYLELVPAEAREAIGMVHRHGEAARHMLENEGFAASGLIDIFDGGPTMVVPRDRIATVRDARILPAHVADDPSLAAAPERLLAVPAAAAFRALRAGVLVGDEAIVLSSAVARGLGVGSGDMVMVC